MDAYRCPTASGPIDATVVLPGSKSITNRALAAAAQADGPTLLTGALLADDTHLMIDSLRRLGVAITVDEEAANIEVTGCGGHWPVEEAELYCGAAGTTMRFCTALCATGYGRYKLDGTQRMRERPIGALVDALRTLGALVEYNEEEGYPPMTVHARHLTGGRVSLDGSVSSQFASALLLASAQAASDVMIELRPPFASTPYLKMTVAIMDRFGVAVVGQFSQDSIKFIAPAPQRYTGCQFHVEPDASSASYFLGAAALTGGRVTIPGLGSASIQGDAAFVRVLQRMGCSANVESHELTLTGPTTGQRLAGLDIDLSDMPDMVVTLAVLALFAEGVTTIRNVGNLRLKETDRLSALRRELTRLGANVEIRDEGLVIEPARKVVPGVVETYDDHRMAMSFALCGLVADGIEIADHQCCKKSLPDFFDLWEQMLAPM